MFGPKELKNAVSTKERLHDRTFTGKVMSFENSSMTRLYQYSSVDMLFPASLVGKSSAGMMFAWWNMYLSLLTWKTQRWQGAWDRGSTFHTSGQHHDNMVPSKCRTIGITLDAARSRGSPTVYLIVAVVVVWWCIYPCSSLTRVTKSYLVDMESSGGIGMGQGEQVSQSHTSDRQIR